MKEFRCIIFNEHEVISAVVERRRRAKVKLPPGTILNLKYSSEGKNQIVTTIRVVDDHGKEEPLVIHTSELVAALIDYCGNRRVPLPAGSRRWIELIGSSDLTLMMDFDPLKKRKKAVRAKSAKARVPETETA